MHFEGRDEGRWKYPVVASGTYAVCFNNEMARFTVKTLSFDWQSTKQASKPTTSGSCCIFSNGFSFLSLLRASRGNFLGLTALFALLCHSEDLTPIQQALQRISSAVDTLQVEQNYFHVREIVHRNSTPTLSSLISTFRLVRIINSLFSAMTIPFDSFLVFFLIFSPPQPPKVPTPVSDGGQSLSQLS